jgi:hypothetical protein
LYIHVQEGQKIKSEQRRAAEFFENNDAYFIQMQIPHSRQLSDLFQPLAIIGRLLLSTVIFSTIKPDSPPIWILLTSQ